jgi:hypothetical protein
VHRRVADVKAGRGADRGATGHHLELDELVELGPHPVGDGQHDPRALVGWEPGPDAGLERRPRGLDREVGVPRRALGDRRRELLVARVADLEDGAGVDVLAADAHREVADCGGGHGAVSSWDRG